MTDHSGKTLGQYQIKERIGKGGMAVVYRAYQASMKRDVAIKVMATELGRDPDFVERFKREAELFAVLQHPHILPVIDFGHHGDAVFIVMRLVEGGSLDEWIKRAKIDLPLAARMLEQIGSALSFAHDKGIVHRDLKPNNVLLDTQGNTYLTDFGIAKMLAGTTKLTATNAVLGTPAYMAPEQWRGDTIDARTDIYSLGIMAYEMVTGRLPFEADTSFTLMYKHFNDLPPEEHMAHLPPPVKTVILKALMKNPEDRFNSAEEFGHAFRAAVEGRPIQISLVKSDNDATMIGGIESPTGSRTAPTDQYTAPISKPNISGVSPLPTPLPVEKKRGGGGLLIGGIGLLLALAIGAALFFLVINKPEDDPKIAEADTATPTATDTPLPTDTSTPTDTPPPTDTNTPLPTDTPTLTDTPEPLTATATVLTQRSSVRTGPGDQYPPAFVVLRGTELEVLAVTTERDWYQVDAGGEVGWILADTVTISGNQSVIEVVEKPTATFTASPTATDTPTATPTDTPTPTNTATDLPRPSATSTGTPEIPPPFTPTPTFGFGGTEVAEDTPLTPEQEREFASRLPFRMEALLVDSFETNANSWEGVGSTVNDGALELVSQGEFAGFAGSRNIPILRDFYVSVEFVGSSNAENYALAIWFRFQEDDSGYVLALDNQKFVQVGYTSAAGYEQVDEVDDLDVDFTRPTRLSAIVIGEFLEIYVNGQYVKAVKLDHPNTPGVVELGVYTFESTDPTVTIDVQDFRLFGLNLQPPLNPENVVLGSLTAPTSLAHVPDGRLTPRRLLRGDVVWVLGRSRGPGEWVYVYTGHGFGWLPARTLTLEANGESVPFNALPETDAQGFALRELDRLIEILAGMDEPPMPEIAINTPTDSLLLAGEVQRWRFIAQPDHAYVITMTQTDMTLDPYLRVKDAGGNIVIEDDDSGGNLNALVRLEVQQGGEFIIEASSLNAADTGEFVLEVQDAGPIGLPDERVVTVGQPIEATLELGDVHRWRLTVRGGETYTITMERSNNDVDPYLTLTDAGGSVLAEDDDSAGNLNAQLVYTFPAPGDYFIEARSYTLTTSGSYTLRVESEGQVTNPTPTIAVGVSTPEAGERILEIGVPQQVFLDVTEVHVWQFEAQAGQTYVITMNNASGTVDPRLTLKNDQGSILAENDDSAGSFNSLITFTPEVSGTYFVEAATFSPTESGDYIIQVVLGE